MLTQRNEIVMREACFICRHDGEGEGGFVGGHTHTGGEKEPQAVQWCLDCQIKVKGKEGRSKLGNCFGLGGDMSFEL